MFSSDPTAGASLFVPGVFVGATVSASADAARSWLPDDIDHAVSFAPDDDEPPAHREAIDDAVRAALEQEAVERERLVAEAYDAGVDAGRAEAEEAMQTAVTSAIEALWVAIEEVRVAETRWTAALQDNVAALAAGAARHVIAREVAADDALVRRLAASAVAEYPQDQALQLRVNPDDLATLRRAFAEVPRAAELRWIADPRVERGGCVAEGRERIVDGRVDTALERVYRTLSGHYA